MASLFIKRGVFVLALLLVGWVVFISWEQFERHERIEEEVAVLQAEAEKIRRENETFSERIGYFSSDAFREQEAKKKLGLKKNNETVVVIKRAAALSEGEGTDSSTPGNKNQALAVSAMYVPNYQKWLSLFVP